jgi:hypothetical protein
MLKERLKNSEKALQVCVAVVACCMLCTSETFGNYLDKILILLAYIIGRVQPMTRITETWRPSIYSINIFLV